MYVCVCVECGHTCAYTNLTFHLYHAWHSCSVFTALWFSCSVIKVTFYLHQTTSWLWLIWGNSPVFTPRGYGPVDTTVQITPGLHCTRNVVDTRQVREYPDSTISKVSTVLTLTHMCRNRSHIATRQELKKWRFCILLIHIFIYFKLGEFTGR